MDPVLVAARERHRTRKARPGAFLSPLQRKLKNNPFARALDTPIRCCDTTLTRLPKSCLLNFELMAHPDTKAPWLLPKGLQAVDPFGDDPDHSLNVPIEEDSLMASPAGFQLPSVPRTLPGPSSYALARHGVLGQLTRGSKRSNWTRLYDAIKCGKTGVKLGDIVWRQDMDVLVRELLAQRVMHEIGDLAERQYISAVKEGTAPHQSACLLWLGPAHASPDPVDAEDFEATTGEPWSFQPGSTRGPAAYASAVTRSLPARAIPSYNLPKMLGGKHTETLRARLGELGYHELLRIRSKPGTVEAQEWLWKLQGYLADANSEVN
ncbi:MAG: hypothetical protein M1838_001831 [Thelocarpon superellum]|nr:MAG: hypothetical protein M1838_001831 [Thelocarpon superellum]